jgi:hypothetical protein
MRSNRSRVAAGAALLAVVAVAVVLAVWLHSRGESAAKTAKPPARTTATATSPFDRPEIARADAARYAALFGSMHVKRTRIGTLVKWPKPYQSYRDQFNRRCYEWKSGRRLYNLCFTNGVLTLKDPA